MDKDPKSALEELLAPRITASGLWLDRTRADARDRASFYASFASATRKLGSAILELSAGETDAVRARGLEWLVTGSAPDEIGRVLLLIGAAGGDGFVELVGEVYRTGDNREKRAVLRALALLPEPARFVEVAVGACRTSVQTVFEGICCENPYPAAHFPEANFNQMVLKALFTGAALARIVGLDGRLGPELGRMAADYASERRAAGRSVPADIGRVLVPEVQSRGDPR